MVWQKKIELKITDKGSEHTRQKDRRDTKQMERNAINL